MGKFIAVYGINNIGKSWHTKYLVDRLITRGKKAVYLKFPVYDIVPTGPFIDKVLRSGNNQTITEEELQLWYTLNRFQFLPTLKKLIEENDYVISEDYIGTALAWGTAKGASLEWLTTINSPLPLPDICIYMIGERKLGSVEKTHIHETNNELIEKTQEVFNRLAQTEGWKIVEKHEDYEITKQRFWDIIIENDQSLR